jgi:feruloyl esterase
MRCKKSSGSAARGALLVAMFSLISCSASQNPIGAKASGIAGQGPLACDDSMKAAFKPDENTRVVLVKSFRKGESLALTETPPDPTPPQAPQDLCLVKMIVGPGSAGTVGAPSTSAGIGIEVWLPAPTVWNKRIRNVGGGGWAGGKHSFTTNIGNASAALSATFGYAVGTTDTGHSVETGAFTVREDGSSNRELWKDFADRSLHELAIKTRALVQAYYRESPAYSYWEGCSTGGRQGYKMAQEHPEYYDGYLIGAPAINWSRFITAELFPQVVMQRDLKRTMKVEKLNHVSAAAVSACDVVGGQHLGFILEPAQCKYDPTRDASVLCKGEVGNGVVGASTHAACVTMGEARVVNKIWYGQTSNGTVPDPGDDNATGPELSSEQHRWWGLKRGTNLLYLAGESSTPPFLGPFPIATDMVALELQNASYATPWFKNVRGDGKDRWKELTYLQLDDAYHRGVDMQTTFGNINTDNPDLRKARDRKAKIISYHGLADELIPPEGSANYFSRMTKSVGGEAEAKQFSRLYLVPGMGHCFGVGSVSGPSGPPASPDRVPLPGQDQFFNLLVNWVERGAAPSEVALSSRDGSVTMPACTYPMKIKYRGTGSVTSATSYRCESPN